MIKGPLVGDTMIPSALYGTGLPGLSVCHDMVHEKLSTWMVKF